MKMCGTGGDKKVLFLVSTFPSVKECVNWVHTRTGAYEHRGSCTRNGRILPRPAQEPEWYSPPLGYLVVSILFVSSKFCTRLAGLYGASECSSPS